MKIKTLLLLVAVLVVSMSSSAWAQADPAPQGALNTAIFADDGSELNTEDIVLSIILLALVLLFGYFLLRG